MKDGRTAWRPGRDRRAEHHPAVPGSPDDARAHHVAVLGGGIAGLTAAVALAERGVAVTLLERHDQLGGRVRSWPVSHADGPATMSRGFHAFFRQYYNLRALLRRTDPTLSRLTPVEDYPLVSAEGHRDSFARIPRTPPLNLATFVLRSTTFTLADLRRIDVKAAGELLDVEFPRTFGAHDGESAAQFLDRLRFPDAARHLALEVFARSFFADPADFAAGELVAMFHSYFLGSAEGLLFDVPDDDYDTALWAPLARHAAALGVAVCTGTEVQSVRSGADGRATSRPAAARCTPTPSSSPPTRPPPSGCSPPTTRCGPTTRGASRLAALRQAPSFAVWRAWLDRPARGDRHAFLGTAGYGVVDNISVLERFEAGAAAWALRTGGSVVELHAYALPDDVSHDAVRAEMRTVLDRLYPEFAGAGIVAEEYLRPGRLPARRTPRRGPCVRTS